MVCTRYPVLVHFDSPMIHGRGICFRLQIFSNYSVYAQRFFPFGVYESAQAVKLDLVLYNLGKIVLIISNWPYFVPGTDGFNPFWNCLPNNSLYCTPLGPIILELSNFWILISQWLFHIQDAEYRKLISGTMLDFWNLTFLITRTTPLK